MKAAIVLCLLACAVGLEVYSEERQRFRSAMASFRSTIGNSRKLVPATGLKTRAGEWRAKPACERALLAFYNKYEEPTCKSFMESTDDDKCGTDCWETKTAAEQGASLNTFCPACKAGLVTGFREIAANCAIPPEDQASFRIIGSYFEMICLSNAGEYCFPKLKAFAEIDDGDDATIPTTAQLDTMCSPCITKILAGLSELSPEIAEGAGFLLGVSCLKDDGRCFAKLFTKARQFGADTDKWGVGLNLVCNRRPSDSALCISEVYNELRLQNLENDDGTPGVCDDLATECPGSACQTSLNAFFTNTDCCGSNWVYLDDPTGASVTAITDVCEVTVPAVCPGFKTLVREFVLYNIACSWYAEHKDAIDAALLLDIAGTVGVEEHLISLTVTCAASTSASGRRLLEVGEVSVEATVIVNDADQETEVNSVDSENLDLFATNKAVPVTGRGNSLYGVRADEPPPAAVAQDEEEQSGAATLVVAAASLTLVALLVV